MPGIVRSKEFDLCVHPHVRATGPLGTAFARCPRSHLGAFQFKRRRARHNLVIAASLVKELPIFPLGVVAFPSCSTPLNIFEARYRSRLTDVCSVLFIPGVTLVLQKKTLICGVLSKHCLVICSPTVLCCGYQVPCAFQYAFGRRRRVSS